MMKPGDLILSDEIDKTVLSLALAHMQDHLDRLEMRITSMDAQLSANSIKLEKVVILVEAGRLGGKLLAWLGGIAIAVLAVLEYFRHAA